MENVSVIITIEELKEYLGIDEEDTSQDAKLQAIVDSTNWQMTEELGRVFGVTGTLTDEVYDYEPTVWLNNMDIQTVTAVKDYDDNEYTGYRFNKLGRLDLSSTFDTVRTKANHDNVKVSYTFGEENVPPDLKLATLQIATNAFGSYGQASSGGEVKAERIGSYSVEYMTASDSSGASSFSSFGSADSVIQRYKRTRI